MRLSYLRASLGVLMLADPISRAAGSQPLQPLKPWYLDYGETQCAATRDYGDAQKPVTLAIIPAPNGTTYELSLLYRIPHTGFADELEGYVDFGSGRIKAWLLRHGSKDHKLTLYRFRIDAAEMAQARAARAVTFHIQGADFTFALDHIPPLLDGLQRCTDDLKSYWNFDGEADGHIAVPAKGDARSVFTADDYPAEAMRNQQEGTAQYLLLIDEKGTVAGCRIVEPSGVPALDAMGCVVLQDRARFTPALDRTGKPVKSTLTTPPITWRIAG